MLRWAPICWAFGACLGRSLKRLPGIAIRQPVVSQFFRRSLPYMPPACITRNGIPRGSRMPLRWTSRFSRRLDWLTGNRNGNWPAKPWTRREWYMSEKILFVDDEPAALDGYRRLLHKAFTVETAVGAPQALQTIAENGPYAVVISD